MHLIGFRHSTSEKQNVKVTDFNGNSMFERAHEDCMSLLL